MGQTKPTPLKRRRDSQPTLIQEELRIVLEHAEERLVSVREEIQHYNPRRGFPLEPATKDRLLVWLLEATGEIAMAKIIARDSLDTGEDPVAGGLDEDDAPPPTEA